MRYSDSIAIGHDWTLRRNGAYLELVDNATDVVLERHLLGNMHSVTLYASNFTADRITIDFTFGGAFSLPGGIHIDGGRDGLAGGSTLHFLGRHKDRVVHLSDTEALVDNTLLISWTNNLAGAYFETHGATSSTSPKCSRWADATTRHAPPNVRPPGLAFLRSRAGDRNLLAALDTGYLDLPGDVSTPGSARHEALFSGFRPQKR